MKKSLKDIFRRNPDRLTRTVKWLFGLPLAFILYLVIGLFIPQFPSDEITMTVKYLSLSLCIVLVIRYFNGFTISKLFSQNGKFRTVVFLKALFLMLLLITGTTFLIMAANPSSFEFSLTDGFAKDWLISFLLIASAALFEELVFRAYIAYFVNDETAECPKGKAVYCLISAFLFTLSHLNNPEISVSFLYSGLFYFMQGFVLMLMMLETKGLEVPLGMHIANNLASSWFFAYDSSVIKTNALYIQHNTISPVLLVQTAFCLFVCVLVLRKQK